MMSTTNPIESNQLPLLPLRDVVVFPNMVIPLFVGRKKSIAAIELAVKEKMPLLLVVQRTPNFDDPTPQDIYEVGCIAHVLQMLKLPDGTVKVLVEGSARAKISAIDQDGGFYRATYQLLETKPIAAQEADALTRSLLEEFEKYVKINKKIPAEILSTLAGMDNLERLVDAIIAHMPLKIQEKQKLLETDVLLDRVKLLLNAIQGEMDIVEVEKRIKGMVDVQIKKHHRDYYLNEQMKAIRRELGEDEASGNDFTKLAKDIKNAGMTEEAKSKAEAELSKLKAMPPMSAEATVSRNYLDTLLSVPWKKRSRVNKNLEKAEKILKHDHYGLTEVVERIVEYLAVQSRVEKLKGPVLCLVGPPGVGKTSLGESVARATGREFVRISLGGVRDEAEIRGHRRTYIGALPGRIIQRMIKAKVKNPLILLDEVDKISSDFRGDPASALLEVLDPEQNNTFNDHYLEVDYDLSDVMFICTANTKNIPPALYDRMEVIQIPGYTEEEKIHIAEEHLIPKQKQRHGLAESELLLPTEQVRDVIRYYTREAGVRSLEREIAKICRKAVRSLATKTTKAKAEKPKHIELKSVVVDSQCLEDYLGVQKFRFGLADHPDQMGQVNGLAWTEVGGEILTIEAAAVAGKGKITSTGHLGEVMQESIQAALTVVRSRAQQLGIAADFYDKLDIHIHVPEGATPKDGPSAGIAMTTALVSVLTGIPVRGDVAMTGEITLRGEVLPIGGLKEKLLAAHRAGIKMVLIPIENQRELKQIPENITAQLDIRPVRWIDEVLTLALQRQPMPLMESLPEHDVLPTKAGKRGRTKPDESVAH